MTMTSHIQCSICGASALVAKSKPNGTVEVFCGAHAARVEPRLLKAILTDIRLKEAIRKILH
jgi:hypothetical protein